MATITTLKIQVEGKEFVVTGGDFYEILAEVKAIQGRRWDGDHILWVLPLTLAEAKEALSDYKILGDEDEVIDAEIEEVEKLQEWILEDIPKIQAEIESLEADRGGYTGKWRSKAAKRSGAWCLRCAIKVAEKSVEEITGPEIASMKRACEIMGWV
jgi:hypothetical protein